MTTEQYDSYYPQQPQAHQAPAPQAYAPPVAQPYGYAPVPQQQPGNGIGIAGFVCGLVGLILCWVPWFGALLGLVGIVLSGIGISQGKKKGASIGLSVAGLVCGILAVLAFVLLLAFVFSVASSISTY
jgi:hypothetical protein